MAQFRVEGVPSDLQTARQAGKYETAVFRVVRTPGDHENAAFGARFQVSRILFSLAKAQRRGVLTGRPSLHLCGFARGVPARRVAAICRAEHAETAEGANSPSRLRRDAFSLLSAPSAFSVAGPS